MQEKHLTKKLQLLMIITNKNMIIIDVIGLAFPKKQQNNIKFI